MDSQPKTTSFAAAYRAALKKHGKNRKEAEAELLSSIGNKPNQGRKEG